MRCRDAEKQLDEVGITCNKNAIPFDPEKPFVTSGLRLGTPAITTRGMKEKDMAQVASFIDEALSHYTDENYLAQTAIRVKAFLANFPLYKELK